MKKSLFLQNKLIVFIFLVFTILSGSVASENTGYCDGRKINISITDSVTTGEIISQFSSMCGFSVFVSDSYARSVLDETLIGINIVDMDITSAINLLLNENGLSYTLDNTILRISGLETKTFKIDYVDSAREGVATLNASVTPMAVEGIEGTQRQDIADNQISTKEEFNFWLTVKEEIMAILNSVDGMDGISKDPIVNTKAGLVTVTGSKAQLEQVSRYIDTLKYRLNRQVLIDVSVIAVDLKDDRTLGIDWSKFELSINNKVSNSKPGSWSLSNLNVLNDISFSFEGLMSFLQQNGDAKIVSNPKILAMNNQQALITVGDNINYRVMEDTTINDSGASQVTYKNYSVFIGILLNILPQISDNNEIMLRINPSVSEFKYVEDDTKQLSIREVAPDTKEKKLSTVVTVNNGDTIILGGLIASNKGKKYNKVPLLGDIPILGYAFKSENDYLTSTELVFVITPRIVDNNEQDFSLKDLGYSNLSL